MFQFHFSSFKTPIPGLHEVVNVLMMADLLFLKPTACYTFLSMLRLICFRLEWNCVTAMGQNYLRLAIVIKISWGEFSVAYTQNRRLSSSMKMVTDHLNVLWNRDWCINVFQLKIVFEIFHQHGLVENWLDFCFFFSILFLAASRLFYHWSNWCLAASHLSCLWVWSLLLLQLACCQGLGCSIKCNHNWW